jgi:spore germination protein YaaH
MKKTGRPLLILLLLIICSGNVLTKNKQPASSFSKTIVSDSNTGDDTIPRPKLNSFIKKPPDSVPKQSNFIDKILAAFKFRKNAQANERIRVKALLDTLRIDTNLVLTMQNIWKLDSALSKSNRYLEARGKDIRVINDSLKNYNSDLNGRIKELTEKLNPRAKEANYDINVELAKVARKMQSIISYNSQDEALRAKMIRIAFIDSIRKISNDTQELKKTDTGAGTENKVYKIKYKMRVKNRAEVYGIYDITTLNDFNTERLNQLDYLLLNSIPVNVDNINKIDQAAEKILTAEDYITEATKKGCQIGLTFTINPSDTITLNRLLNNSSKQNLFIRNALLLLSYLHAGAVNIAIDTFPAALEKEFVTFIKKLSNILQVQVPAIKLLITLPANQRDQGLIIKLLDKYTDRFVIDFSRNYNKDLPGPTAPLSGEQPSTIESTVSWYKSQQIPAEKIVLELPYKGTTWAFSKSFVSSFGGYFGYADIRKNFEAYYDHYFKHYNPDSTIAMMDLILNEDMSPARIIIDSGAMKDTLPIIRIYYDDEVTLGKKYQYVLDNKLKGVALNSLGDDNGYSDLWDEMTYRFADSSMFMLRKDTNDIPTANPNLNFLQKCSRYFTLFNFIQNNPCAVCFENVKEKDSAEYMHIKQCMIDLHIHEKMLAENKIRIANGENPFRSHFEYVKYLLENLLKWTTLVIFLLLLIMAAFYIIKTKNQGDTWAWKKKVGWICVVLCVLTVINLFSYLFCSDKMPFFGTAPSNSLGFSKDVLTQLGAKDDASDVEDTYCNADPSQTCFDMPLPVLLLVILVGLFIGYLITRLLIVPIIKRRDIP